MLHAVNRNGAPDAKEQGCGAPIHGQQILLPDGAVLVHVGQAVCCARKEHAYSERLQLPSSQVSVAVMLEISLSVARCLLKCMGRWCTMQTLCDQPVSH